MNKNKTIDLSGFTGNKEVHVKPGINSLKRNKTSFAEQVILDLRCGESKPVNIRLSDRLINLMQSDGLSYREIITIALNRYYEDK